MKKLAIAAGAAAMALGAAGCHKDTPAEKQVEKQADAIGDAYKADAKMVRAEAAGAPDQKAQEAAADSLENKGEAVEKHLKNEADELGKDTRRMSGPDKHPN